LGAATRAIDRARNGAGELPLRLGYVSWLPPEAAAMPDLRVRVDEWVLPSHTQAARVAEGSLDLAIAWIEEADVERYNLAAHLLRYERLEVVMPRTHQATRHDSVPAAEITVLVDVDEASWSSWNRYAIAFAKASHASVTNIDDGGITGPAFFDHVARLGRPVLQSPKRHAAAMPPMLTRRPVRSPVPLWAWALLHRSDDARPMITRATRTLLDHGSTCNWRTTPAEPYWCSTTQKRA
jgi:DNA-binding transcriptional LysR family regulator